MARKRLVSPAFFKHHDLYKAEVETGLPLRIGYEALWCQSDRRGLFRWKPVELKLECLPYDPCDFEVVLFALEDRGFVECYQVEGKLYGRIPSFGDHQSFHVAEKPDLKIPEPDPRAPKPTRSSDQHGASMVLTPDKHGASTPVAVAVAVTGTSTVSDACSTDVTAPCRPDVGLTAANSRSTKPAIPRIFEQQEAELRAIALPHQALAMELLLEPLGSTGRITAIGEIYAVAKRMAGHEVRGKNTGAKAGPEHVVRALSEMAATNMTWNIPLFRGCVRRIVDRPPEPPTELEREQASHAREISARANVAPEAKRDPAEIEAMTEQRKAAMAKFFEMAGDAPPVAREKPPARSSAPHHDAKDSRRGGSPAPIGDLLPQAARGMLP